MGRKRHVELPGLAELGAALKALREKAGLSQMKLAGRMGFVPAHGYKYIFRIEKGLVPNPTLRTLASYLAACGAGWQEIAAFLPASATAKKQEKKAAPARAEQRAEPKPEPARPRDTRPRRLALRGELRQSRQEHASDFWARFEKAEQKAAELLAQRRVVSNEQRRYLAFLRSAFSVADAYLRTRPGLLDAELARSLGRARAAGLDESLLLEMRDLCLEHMGLGEVNR